MEKHASFLYFDLYIFKTNLLKGLATETLGKQSVSNIIMNHKKTGNYKPVSLPRILN